MYKPIAFKSPVGFIQNSLFSALRFGAIRLCFTPSPHRRWTTVWRTIPGVSPGSPVIRLYVMECTTGRIRRHSAPL